MSSFGLRSNAHLWLVAHEAHCLWVGVRIGRALFQALRIPERVKSMVRGGAARVNAGYHHDLALMGIQERVTQHHRELGRSERNVRAARVKSSDALLEREQTRVDRGALHATLSVITLAVCCPLRSSQVYEQQFALCLATRVLDFDLADGMRS